MPEDRDISKLDSETQAYIHALREEAKGYRISKTEAETRVSERDKAIADASTRLDELNAQVAASQKLRTDFDALKDQHAQVLSKAENESLELTRIKIAMEAQLPYDFADRLKGDTEDALKADAQAFKTRLGTAGVGGVAFDKSKTTDSGPELDPIRARIALELAKNQE